MNEDVKSLKENIDTLIDENERLRKKIKTLEASKEADDFNNDAVNAFEKEAEKVLEKLLREYRPKWHEQRYLDDDLDWSYIPERDDMDWSYRPRRGTFDPRDYWWPGYPAWWGIIPPWVRNPYEPYCNDATSTGSPKKDYVHVYSSNKTEN